MNRRRKRPNWFMIILLCLLILAGSYVNRYIIADIQPIGVPTATATVAPESLIAQAEGEFKDGKLIPAIETYKRAIASRPDDPAVYIKLAQTQVFAGKYKDAQTSAEDALLLNPTNSMAFAVRAWALSFQGEYIQAEDDIRRALELDSNNALAYSYQVEILVNSYYDGVSGYESLEKAAEISKVAQGLAPDTLETHRARGIILQATGTENYEEAIREYEAAVAINPNIADLHLSIGNCYRFLGDYEKAIDSFTRANALNPEDPTPDLFMSRTYATRGEYGKAMQYAESAVTDNPTDTNLRGNLGVMYYRNSYWPEAVKELEYVVKGGTTEEGIQMESINLTPDSPRIAEYYFTYALTLSRLEQCGEALQIAQLIISRIPSDELAVENANEVTNRCQQNLAQTPEPPLASRTATAEPVSTIESTPTP